MVYRVLSGGWGVKQEDDVSDSAGTQQVFDKRQCFDLSLPVLGAILFSAYLGSSYLGSREMVKVWGNHRLPKYLSEGNKSPSIPFAKYFKQIA